MNGIIGISFQEVPGGIKVHVKKGQNKSSPGKLKKRLPYNFKQMSKQIMMAKTSDAARPLVTQIQAKLSWLYRKLRSDEYGDSEIAAAIIHAATMERIAKRKVRHLEEEEAAENGTGLGMVPGEEDEIYGKDELEKSLEENENISEEEMKKMMEEIEKLEEELAEETLSEIQDMISCASGDMSEEEIEELKRKHRNEEDRQLTRADLEYLKALFDRLEQEKKQAASGISSYRGSDTSSVSYVVECVPEIEMTDVDVGECVDVSV
ncbi:MAG: hypothetical protein J5802_00570 [Butyrivibrio sp.]|nr:hypothetical protein [Butyrivibrio sp.]